MANDSKVLPTNSVVRLANEIRRSLQIDIVNGYTTLSPRHSKDVVTMKVKDARSNRMLTVTITESDS